MPHSPDDISDLMIELSLALSELASRMSDLAVTLHDDDLQQASTNCELSQRHALAAIDKAKQ